MIALLLKENRRLRESLEASNDCIREVNLQVCGVGVGVGVYILVWRGVTLTLAL